MKQVSVLAEGWNAGFVEGEEREIVPRDYLYASELGNAPIDIFLLMKGTKPSNPPNDRAKRKMSAGSDWEHTIEGIFRAAGILVAKQVKCDHQYEGLLSVHGRLDFLIGGKADVAAGEAFIAEGVKLGYISEQRARAARKAMQHYAEKYPEGFPAKPFELKSVSDYTMDMMEVSKMPVARNVHQITHYAVALDYESGVLGYLNRNDERLMEFEVDRADGEAAYRARIENMSKYWHADEQPPKEKMIIFDADAGKFSKNLNLEWSNYLEMLYGFKEPREYGEKYAPKAANFNRVMQRVVSGAKITDKNKLILDEIEQEGFVVEEITKQFKGKVEAEE